ncbi:hypothetical protein P153DRAFT_402353 [Dothidotthia symphoricarpi CBS 119687]|uniref:Uncharacterized protein n=1 Tax=Dothidotthia symphoricarpi CBS 119687 TaxID=1392245 RepID=A0A6A6AUJ2_9PLEO|nr:uncharacterized protein P153DRAFT_402353 [Dothidotthia symphoricarpi CBS 119687]KAF2134604.1 hypothetical protein P153DRAFT_402353 [Dothidotthia symphoricarpi CBS 119687]
MCRTTLTSYTFCKHTTSTLNPCPHPSPTCPDQHTPDVLQAPKWCPTCDPWKGFDAPSPAPAPLAAPKIPRRDGEPPPSVLYWGRVSLYDVQRREKIKRGLLGCAVGGRVVGREWGGGEEGEEEEEEEVSDDGEGEEDVQEGWSRPKWERGEFWRARGSLRGRGGREGLKYYQGRGVEGAGDADAVVEGPVEAQVEVPVEIRVEVPEEVPVEILEEVPPAEIPPVDIPPVEVPVEIPVEMVYEQEEQIEKEGEGP